MNPDQLCGTTLRPRRADPAASQSWLIWNEADWISLLPSSWATVVEPRCEFIQQNALNVANLDFIEGSLAAPYRYAETLRKGARAQNVLDPRC